MAEIVSYTYIFHLTWPMLLHYLVKGGCSKFLHITGFVTIILLRFGVKVKSLLSQQLSCSEATARHCAGCLQTIFYASARWHPGASARDTVTFLERETRETRRRLTACVRVHGAHFQHEFWQFWVDLSWQLITLLNKPSSVYCVLIQSSDILLQIIHFNVM